MKPLKILLVSSEVTPFAKTGGLADVVGSLPLSLKSLGCEVKVFLPYYRQIKNKDFGITLLKENIKVELSTASYCFSLCYSKRKDVDFYFIDKDEYFDRDFLYGTPSGDYRDNAIRFAFFVKAVLLKRLSGKKKLFHL